MAELREAECCYNCESFRQVRYSCWGECPKSPHEDHTVYYHQICDEFDWREGDLEYTSED